MRSLEPLPRHSLIDRNSESRSRLMPSPAELLRKFRNVHRAVRMKRHLDLSVALVPYDAHGRLFAVERDSYFRPQSRRDHFERPYAEKLHSHRGGGNDAFHKFLLVFQNQLPDRNMLFLERFLFELTREAAPAAKFKIEKVEIGVNRIRMRHLFQKQVVVFHVAKKFGRLLSGMKIEPGKHGAGVLEGVGITVRHLDRRFCRNVMVNGRYAPVRCEKPLYLILPGTDVEKVDLFALKRRQRRLMHPRHIVRRIAELLPCRPGTSKAVGAVRMVEDDDIFFGHARPFAPFNEFAHGDTGVYPTFDFSRGRLCRGASCPRETRASRRRRSKRRIGVYRTRTS